VPDSRRMGFISKYSSANARYASGVPVEMSGRNARMLENLDKELGPTA
jgi:hypothetical protein